MNAFAPTHHPKPPRAMPYEYIDYATIATTREAAKVGLRDFGPECKIPNLIITGVPEDVAPEMSGIISRFERFASVKRLLHHWERGTWLYLCGFRLPNENGSAEIIPSNLSRAIALLHRPCAIRCLAYRLGIDPIENTLPETWKQIVQHSLVSDIESALLNIHSLEDLTGSGSDGMNVGGREELFDYFGISQFNKERNKRLVSQIKHLRQIGQAWN